MLEMVYRYNKSLIPLAQELRKSMTDEESHLWYDFLKKLPCTVNRQSIIGNYIVDFFIASKRIVIEIDGLQHKLPENKEKDTERDRNLNALGITVLRYTNKEINQNFHGVCEDILTKLNLKPSDLIHE